MCLQNAVNCHLKIAWARLVFRLSSLKHNKTQAPVQQGHMMLELEKLSLLMCACTVCSHAALCVTCAAASTRSGAHHLPAHAEQRRVCVSACAHNNIV
jgi:hypothetical protein